MGKKELAKSRILESAKELFRDKGYENVSVREIAKKADCSHTTIYFYFKDKLGVLEEIAKAPLEELYNTLFSIQEESISPIQKTQKMAHMYVIFGLQNSDLYDLFMTYKGIRVDSEKADWNINALRLRIFDLFYATLRAEFAKYKDMYNELDLARGIFFTLHGAIMTYADSDEDNIIERVLDILNNYLAFIFRESINEDK